MKVRLGLFRTWLVLSVIWACTAFAIDWQDIYAPILPAKSYFYIWDKPKDPLLIPASADLAALSKTHKSVEFPYNTILYAANYVPDETLELITEDFNDRYAMPRRGESQAKQLHTVARAAWLSAVPSVSLLLFGAACLWTVAQFKPRS